MKTSNQKMIGTAVVAIIVISIFGVGIPLAFSIASLVIGSQNMAATCDAGSFMLLSNWLIVYGSVNLVGTLVALTIVIMIALESPWGAIGSIVYLVLLSFFNLAWNIVGAVALFRDGMNCQTLSYSLWAMTLAVLIIQWIGMLASCCSFRKE